MKKSRPDDHRRFGGIVAVVALPDQNFIDVLAFFFGGVHGDVGAGFVVDPLPLR